MTETERLMVIRDYHAVELRKYENLLADPSKSVVNKKLTTEYVINSICEFYNISKKELNIRRRDQMLVRRRSFTIKILRDYCSLSTNKIAITLNYNNHATILYHLRKVNDYLSNEFYGYREYKKEYNQILNYLGIYEEK